MKKNIQNKFDKECPACHKLIKVVEIGVTDYWCIGRITTCPKCHVVFCERLPRLAKTE